MRIIGVDHATIHGGIAMLESRWMRTNADLAFVFHDTINLKDFETSPMYAMFNIVDAYIHENKPDVIALEKPMSLRNGDTARKLIEVYSAAKLAAEHADVEVIEVTPQLAKMYTAGHAAAEKDDVARALEARFDLAYDAIAIPVYYKDKKRKGQIRERLYDVSDACALCVAAAQIKAKELTA